MATAFSCRSMGLRQTGVPSAIGNARKIRKEYGQTTVESKLEAGRRTDGHGCVDVYVAETTARIAGVPLKVTLTVSARASPTILIYAPEQRSGWQPVSHDGIRSCAP